LLVAATTTKLLNADNKNLQPASDFSSFYFLLSEEEEEFFYLLYSCLEIEWVISKKAKIITR
jgi:hypothetical protein